MFNEVLKFWFEEIDPNMWWIADPIFDSRIKDRFIHLLNQAEKGELYGWRKEPKGRLAEIIVLDQFSRNIYRNTPKAFLNDAMALVLAQEAVRLKAPKLLSATGCTFLLAPYMHSESYKIHEVAEMLYRESALPLSYEFELKHKKIINRFGRYPHRNAILGRISSTEETEFLKQPGSSF
ncbi:MAG: DUF924 family protein [Nitrosomonas sp.]